MYGRNKITPIGSFKYQRLRLWVDLGDLLNYFYTNY
jgi:hypothetical protein